MSAARAPLYEVFSSVQGEGLRVGERHLFVRFAGCDLECAFCDTPASRRVPARARLLLPDGAIDEAVNPLDRERLDAWVDRLDEAAGPHHALSLTGGEPLLFAAFWRPLAGAWRARGGAVLLETGGHRPAELARVADEVDVVSADVKLASTAGFATDPETTRAFLRLVSGHECVVKAVVSARTTPAEVAGVARLVAEEAPGAPLALQPVSGARFSPPDGTHLLALQRAAMRHHRPTRVIPQVHRFLHLR